MNTLIWIDEYHQPKPVLEGFERVLDRKFTQFDCVHPKCPCGSYWCATNHIKKCPYIKLSDETKAEIKLKDTEIAETKIDTHPRFSLGIISYIPKHHSFSHEEEWVFCSRENITLYRLFTNRPEDIKLELIL